MNNFQEKLDVALNELINQIEWSVKVLGAVDVDREKEAVAKAEAKKTITALVESDLIGDDVPLEFKNAHIDIEREGANKLRAHQRQVLHQKGEK